MLSKRTAASDKKTAPFRTSSVKIFLKHPNDEFEKKKTIGETIDLTR